MTVERPVRDMLDAWVEGDLTVPLGAHDVFDDAQDLGRRDREPLDVRAGDEQDVEVRVRHLITSRSWKATPGPCCGRILRPLRGLADELAVRAAQRDVARSLLQP